MSKQILVIDDDAGIRQSFVLALEDTQYLVDTAQSGFEGVQMEKAKPYDLIFLDLKMPGMDGVETLRHIRGRNNTVPIYIATAFHKEFLTKLQAADQEGISFQLLKKPVDSEQILLVTRGVLEGPVAF
jgi:CheY-like chemotaxis protein